MARDAAHTLHKPNYTMTVAVRDDKGPVLEANFSVAEVNNERLD